MEIDRIHFYVADANQMRDRSIDCLGLQYLDDRSTLDTTTHLVGNDRFLFSLSSPLLPSSPVTKYLALHPQGVSSIDFKVRDIARLRRKIAAMGVEIMATSNEFDRSTWIKVRGWGSIDHTISQLTAEAVIDLDSSDLDIDHLVLNVGVGELAAAVDWYRNLFGFQVQQTFQINTDKSGLASQALTSPDGKIRFNINQPTSPNSQIQEFLDFNHGAGIQHIALSTNDILGTVDRMQLQGLKFLSVPQTYYPNLHHRAIEEQMLTLNDEQWESIERLQILVDWEIDHPKALLMQTFTQPIFTEPTFFFEVIERRNHARGFGQGNFQALFESIEQNSFQFYPDSTPQPVDIEVVDAP